MLHNPRLLLWPRYSPRGISGISYVDGCSAALYTSACGDASIHHVRPMQQVSETKRVYIYSENDDMVPWQHIQDHAAETTRLGLNVELAKKFGSRHVAHARIGNARGLTDCGPILLGGSARFVPKLQRRSSRRSIFSLGLRAPP